MNRETEKNKELIQRYLADDSPDKQNSSISELLEKNPELDKYLRRSEKVWELLGQAEMVEPNPNYISNFWSRLREEEQIQQQGFLDKIAALNIRWVFVSSFVTVLFVSALIVNVFILNSDKETQFTFNKQDEMLINNLDKAITKKTAASLDVFGPWEE